MAMIFSSKFLPIIHNKPPHSIAYLKKNSNVCDKSFIVVRSSHHPLSEKEPVLSSDDIINDFRSIFDKKGNLLHDVLHGNGKLVTDESKVIVDYDLYDQNRDKIGQPARDIRLPDSNISQEVKAGIGGMKEGGIRRIIVHTGSDPKVPKYAVYYVRLQKVCG